MLEELFYEFIVTHKVGFYSSWNNIASITFDGKTQFSVAETSPWKLRGSYMRQPENSPEEISLLAREKNSSLETLCACLRHPLRRNILHIKWLRN